ncbi:MAG: HEAT repeat domain-containing protein [Alkalinema sp. CAN_BIN05]|nr:HEAT repeat domain-containing protein [Alkalinema sp. CAN_BIN05]
MEQVAAEFTLVTSLSLELETAIAASDWGEVCKLAERSFFSAQAVDRTQIQTQILNGQILNGQILNGLLQALEWGDFQVRWDVSKLLPKLGNSAIEPLLNRLNDLLNDTTDSDEELQWFIVRTLGAWEDDGVMLALLEVFRSGNPDVQSMSATVLAQYGDRSLTVLKSMLETGLETASSSLWAVRILANIRTVETVEMLLQLAVHLNPEVCCTAIAALGNFQDNRIAVVLIQSLKSPIARIRETAAEAIAFCQTLSFDRRIEVLTPLLWDLNSLVCVRSATSLGRLGDGATESLLRALKSEPLPDALAIELVRSLLRVESVEALIGLFKASQTMSLVRTELLRALGRVRNLKELTVAYLTQLIQQNLALTDRKLAVTALGNLAHPDAIDHLLDQFTTVDSSLRFHILQALQQIDRTGPEPIVRAAIQQKMQDIRISAELKSGLEFAVHEWR